MLALPIQTQVEHQPNPLGLFAYLVFKWRVRMESKARLYRDKAAMAWMQFCKTVLAIKQSQIWKFTCDNWDEYCRDTFGISSARVSQYKGALAYAQAIEDSGYAFDETEGNLRKLRRVVKPDDPLMIGTYTTAQSVAQELGLQKPSESIYRHAYETLQEASVTGHVDINGAQVSVNIDNAIEAAVMGSINEARLRNIERMEPRTKITGTLTRLGNGFQFVPDDNQDIEIDDSIQVTLYISERK